MFIVLFIVHLLSLEAKVLGQRSVSLDPLLSGKGTHTSVGMLSGESEGILLMKTPHSVK